VSSGKHSLSQRVVRSLWRRIRPYTPTGRAELTSGPAPAGMPVLFVGGTGRSGTTITGRLLAEHPDWVMLPSETKFITGYNGLCDLVRGKASWSEFLHVVRSREFKNAWGRGLHLMADAEAIEALLPALRRGLRRNPWAAAATFVHELLDPVAKTAGATGWVDTTPTNVAKGPELLRMFPNMKLVHVVRDGRDVATSVTRRRWGPNDPDRALDWWAVRLRRSFRAGDQLPDSHFLTLQFEDLYVRERQRDFPRLLEFTGLTEDPAVRAFFESETPADRAHAGRWRSGVPPERLAAFEEHHDRLAADLLARGRPYRPVILDPSPELAAARS
jgi:hypothetical protein